MNIIKFSPAPQNLSEGTKVPAVIHLAIPGIEPQSKSVFKDRIFKIYSGTEAFN
jgi:hypothetical protein